MVIFSNFYYIALVFSLQATSLHARTSSIRSRGLASRDGDQRCIVNKPSKYEVFSHGTWMEMPLAAGTKCCTHVDDSKKIIMQNIGSTCPPITNDGVGPSVSPLAKPASSPSTGPSASSSANPSYGPTRSPSLRPSGGPSATPFGSPSSLPSAGPIASPSTKPSSSPSKFQYGDVRDEIVGLVANNTILAGEGQQSQISLRQDLGDFDDLNDLFGGLVIGFPDLDFSAGKVLGLPLRLLVFNMTCYSIAVDDIVIDYRKTGNTIFDFNVDLQRLDVSCDLKWSYKWSFFDGSGRAQVYTGNNNDMATDLRFYSQPTSISSVESCNAAISINDIDIQGGYIPPSIVEVSESSLRERISKEIENTACEELGSLGTILVQDIMLEYVEA